MFPIRELIILIILCLAVQIFGQENRIKIAVIDTGINEQLAGYLLCQDGYKDFTGQGTKDIIGHGTNVSGLIMSGIDTTKYCIVMLKYYNDYPHTEKEFNDSVVFYENAVKSLLTINPKYVNLSVEGEEFYKYEFDIIKQMTNNGTIFTVAAGNHHKDLSIKCDTFPACYNIKKNFYVVGAPANYSNFNGPVKWLENGIGSVFNTIAYGTSQASAQCMNKLLKGEICGQR